MDIWDVIASSADQKRCSKCGEIVSADIFICPKCKNESFK
jgi:RNA polymerase subunit RPABC4/transcription elongation factor Spt4